jgi:hypothetical protein
MDKKNVQKSLAENVLTDKKSAYHKKIYRQVLNQKVLFCYCNFFIIFFKKGFRDFFVL